MTDAPNIEPHFTFTGRQYDVESGLYYYRARYYDSSIGRFLQVDPHPGEFKNPLSSVNKYIYTQNNPINWVDPSGEFIETIIIGAIIGAVIGAIDAALRDPSDIGGILEGMFEGAVVGAITAALIYIAPTGGWIALGLSLANGLMTRGNAFNNFYDNAKKATVGKIGSFMAGEALKDLAGGETSFTSWLGATVGAFVGIKSIQDTACDREKATDFARQNICWEK